MKELYYVDHLKLYEGLHPVKSWLTSEVPARLQEDSSPQEVPDRIEEQPIFDDVADLESSVEGHLGASVPLEVLQLPDNHDNSDEDSIVLNQSPIPSTSRGPDLPPLTKNLGSRYSGRPRKPKIDSDFIYY